MRERVSASAADGATGRLALRARDGVHSQRSRHHTETQRASLRWSQGAAGDDESEATTARAGKRATSQVSSPPTPLTRPIPTHMDGFDSRPQDPTPSPFAPSSRTKKRDRFPCKCSLVDNHLSCAAGEERVYPKNLPNALDAIPPTTLPPNPPSCPSIPCAAMPDAHRRLASRSCFRSRAPMVSLPPGMISWRRVAEREWTYGCGVEGAKKRRNEPGRGEDRVRVSPARPGRGRERGPRTQTHRKCTRPCWSR